MNLTDRLVHVLQDMQSVGNDELPCQRIISMIDLTLLDTQATSDDITHLSHTANQYQVAAICVFPNHLNFISPENTVKCATVVNFPTGNEPPQRVINTLKHTIKHQKIDEIDYVFPYQIYLAGNKKAALANCNEIYQFCKEHKLILKVILETGALPSNEVIYEMSTAILQNGCEFLKTSTGKIARGATLPAVFSMLSAIVDSNIRCGIKVSGGIKTKEQALNYMQLTQHMTGQPLDKHCFRLGASSLLNELVSM